MSERHTKLENKDSPASPCGLPLHPGLTKREYFAGLAMQGFVAGNPHSVVAHIVLAEKAVRAADALLDALEKPE